MHSNDDGVFDEAPFLDADEFGSVMTIHKATFQKLAGNRDLNDQLADFFEDLAATYLRISERLRHPGPQ